MTSIDNIASKIITGEDEKSLNATNDMILRYQGNTNIYSSFAVRNQSQKNHRKYCGLNLGTFAKGNYNFKFTFSALYMTRSDVSGTEEEKAAYFNYFAKAPMTLVLVKQNFNSGVTTANDIVNSNHIIHNVMKLKSAMKTVTSSVSRWTYLSQGGTNNSDYSFYYDVNVNLPESGNYILFLYVNYPEDTGTTTNFDNGNVRAAWTVYFRDVEYEKTDVITYTTSGNPTLSTNNYTMTQKYLINHESTGDISISTNGSILSANYNNSTKELVVVYNQSEAVQNITITSAAADNYKETSVTVPFKFNKINLNASNYLLTPKAETYNGDLIPLFTNHFFTLNNIKLNRYDVVKLYFNDSSVGNIQYNDDSQVCGIDAGNYNLKYKIILNNNVKQWYNFDENIEYQVTSTIKKKIISIDNFKILYQLTNESESYEKIFSNNMLIPFKRQIGVANTEYRFTSTVINNSDYSLFLDQGVMIPENFDNSWLIPKTILVGSETNSDNSIISSNDLKNCRQILIQITNNNYAFDTGDIKNILLSFEDNTDMAISITQEFITSQTYLDDNSDKVFYYIDKQQPSIIYLFVKMDNSQPSNANISFQLIKNATNISVNCYNMYKFREVQELDYNYDGINYHFNIYWLPITSFNHIMIPAPKDNDQKYTYFIEMYNNLKKQANDKSTTFMIPFIYKNNQFWHPLEVRRNYEKFNS